MAKVKIYPDDPPPQDLPPIPGGEEQEPDTSGLSSPSIGSGSPDVVAEDLAADLIGLPFDLWAQFEPEEVHEAIVLSEKTKSFLGGPVSRIMTKYGLGKIAKDEVVVIVALSVHTFSAVRAIRKDRENRLPVENPKP